MRKKGNSNENSGAYILRIFYRSFWRQIFNNAWVERQT
jgi:hypothetical protein